MISMHMNSNLLIASFKITQNRKLKPNHCSISCFLSIKKTIFFTQTYILSGIRSRNICICGDELNIVIQDVPQNTTQFEMNIRSRCNGISNTTSNFQCQRSHYDTRMWISPPLSFCVFIVFNAISTSACW